VVDLGLLERANLSRFIDPVSETLCFLALRIPDEEKITNYIISYYTSKSIERWRKNS
jgi:hypothetical protein